jgi:hypothetical protein
MQTLTLWPQHLLPLAMHMGSMSNAPATGLQASGLVAAVVKTPVLDIPDTTTYFDLWKYHSTAGQVIGDSFATGVTVSAALGVSLMPGMQPRCCWLLARTLRLQQCGSAARSRGRQANERQSAFGPRHQIHRNGSRFSTPPPHTHAHCLHAPPCLHPMPNVSHCWGMVAPEHPHALSAGHPKPAAARTARNHRGFLCQLPPEKQP